MVLDFERESALGRAVIRVAYRALPIRFQTILCQIFGGQWHSHRLLSDYVRLLLAVLSHQSFILIHSSIIDAVQPHQLTLSSNEALKHLSMSGNSLRLQCSVWRSCIRIWFWILWQSVAP